MMTRSVVVLLGCLLTGSGVGVDWATASNLFVDADAAPSGDGLSWATAFVDLNDALDLARGDGAITEVWIAESTYRPDSSNVNISFELVSGVALLGGFAGNETEPDQRDPTIRVTVLSGDLTGNDLPGFLNRTDNSRNVIHADNLSAAAILDGLTVTGGNADFDGDDLLGGGGVFAENSDLTLINCHFTENTAGTLAPTLGNFGAAVYVKFSGDLTITDCLFTNNRANSGGAVGVEQISDASISTVEIRGSTFLDNDVPTQTGGAIRVHGDTFILEDSVIDGNHAGYGGAMNLILLDRVEIRDTVFSNNVADVQAAGIWMDRCDSNDVTPAVVERCTFEDNFTDGGVSGGTLLLSETIIDARDTVFRRNTNFRISPIDDSFEGEDTVRANFESGHRFVNCVWDSNFAALEAGVEIEQASATFINCTFTNNTAAINFPAPCAISANAGTVTVDNCILWNNRFGTGENNDLPGSGPQSAQIRGFTGAILLVNRSLIQGLNGGLGGVGNIDSDPLFVSDSAGDLRLSAGSPAVDAGGNTAVPSDILTDLDGLPRFVDDPATVDTGEGTPPIVDMGAYEFQSTDSACEGDANGDGTVDPLDYGFVLARFGCVVGAGDPDCDAADTNADTVVDPLDAGFVQARFGECS